MSIGEKIIDAIIDGPLLVARDKDNTKDCVIVWSRSAISQLEALCEEWRKEKNNEDGKSTDQ